MALNKRPSHTSHGDYLKPGMQLDDSRLLGSEAV